MEAAWGEGANLLDKEQQQISNKKPSVLLEDIEKVCVLQLQVKQANPWSSLTLVKCRATTGERVQITDDGVDQAEDEPFVFYDCQSH